MRDDDIDVNNPLELKRAAIAAADAAFEKFRGELNEKPKRRKRPTSKAGKTR